MNVKNIDSKDPSEIIPVTFDFGRLVTSIDSVTGVSVSVKGGVDEAVGNMKLGACQINGKQVTQIIRNGVDNVTYMIRADISSESFKYSLACYMAVKSL